MIRDFVDKKAKAMEQGKTLKQIILQGDEPAKEDAEAIQALNAANQQK